MRYLLIVLALTASVAGCEKDAGSSETATSAVEGEVSEESEATYEAEGFSVGKLKMVAASKVYKNPGATHPDDVKKQLVEALKKTKSHDPGAAPIYGSITYDARTVTSVDGEESRDVVLIAGLRRKGDDDPTTKYTAEIIIGSEPGSDESFRDLTKDAVAQFAERVDAAVRIRGAGPKALSSILKSADESEKAKVAAIQQIRERQVDGTEPILRDILAAKNDESDSLRVAAAAALARLGDAESKDDILELAQVYSRDKNPNLMPMLYILADIGGEEVVTYLTTVSEAHSSPAVRQVAKEAVDKAIESTALKAPK